MGAKRVTVRRMFWGRGSWYKTSFHFIVFGFTGLLLITGILNRVGAVQSREEFLNISYGALGNSDLLLQGSSVTSVLALDAKEVNYRVYEYTVAKGDTLDDIAKTFSITKDTLKWANDRILSPFNDNVLPGWVLNVPEMNGVLYTAKSGDNLDKVVATTKGNRFDIIELNELVPPNYNIKEGTRIFVPDGTLPPPPAPIPQPRIRRTPGSGGYIGSGRAANTPLGSLPAGTFDDPLTHPSCGGYVWMRGFTYYHSGVDLAKGGGCPIRAVAAGTVIDAGWLGGSTGYGVVIDHGSGVSTSYFHSDGNIWVSVGQHVSKGQDIMYMGSTGNSTGTHLHLTLKYNGQPIDPSPYIPYRR
jgi:murein DD-endopeptidase MepM/ murein hydrolase activator NlpD